MTSWLRSHVFLGAATVQLLGPLTAKQWCAGRLEVQMRSSETTPCDTFPLLKSALPDMDLADGQLDITLFKHSAAWARVPMGYNCSDYAAWEAAARRGCRASEYPQSA